MPYGWASFDTLIETLYKTLIIIVSIAKSNKVGIAAIRIGTVKQAVSPMYYSLEQNAAFRIVIVERPTFFHCHTVNFGSVWLLVSELIFD